MSGALVYGDVCSGISAPTVAWHSLGWRCAFYSEIEKAPRALLKHHYPETPLHGDFTTIKAGDYEAIDLLVGGTPCQDFSVAGLRKGLAGERGNLTLEFVRLAERLQPRWLVYENVPGILSQDEGRAFGAFLWLLGECGYGFAYRVLDAQYAGVAQRRERLFLVGHLGDWRRPAAVLFDAASLRWDSPPSREKGERVAPTIASRATAGGGLGTDFDLDGGLVNSLTSKSHPDRGDGSENLITGTLNCNTGPNGHDAGNFASNQAVDAGFLIAHSLRADGFDASEDGTGRGTPLVVNARQDPITSDIAQPLDSDGHSQAIYPIQSVQGVRDKKQNGIGIGKPDDPMFTVTGRDRHAVAFSCKDHGADAGDLSPTLRAMGHAESHANAGGQVAVAFGENIRAEVVESVIARSLAVGGGKPGQGYPAARTSSGVRRLTPRECERLMAFPDDYTLVPYRNGMMKDGPRYKMLGNSMVVNELRWVGERIAQVHNLKCAA